jgi:hypothetical protein
VGSRVLISEIWYYISEQRNMTGQLVLDLSKELINFEMPQISCIISGIDETGAHIYTIRNDQYTCNDSVGFAAIGIGARHASSQLMLSGQSWTSTVSDTALAVYNAKKRAEVAPGVGKATDLVTIGPGLGTFSTVRDDLVKRLDQEYQTMIKVEKKALAKAQKGVESYVKELEQPPKPRDEAPPQTSPEGGTGDVPTDGDKAT